jgi:hypothetical protein
MTPINNGKKIEAGQKMGAFDMRWPGAVEGVIYRTYIYKWNESRNEAALCENGSCLEPVPLLEGKYRIYHECGPGYGGILMNDKVPVQTGYVTKLKMGLLHILLPGGWTVVDSLKQPMTNGVAGTTFKKLLLPVGVYHVGNAGTYRRVVIKDKETVVLKLIKSITEPKWVITPMTGVSSASIGRLNTYFIEDKERSFAVFLPSTTTTPPGEEAHSLPPDQKSYNLVAGKYHISLNGVPVWDLPVENGKETRITAGYLYISNLSDTTSWELGSEPAGSAFRSGKGRDFIALPAGVYWLYVKTDPPLKEPVLIKDKKTTKIEF